jgi:hypothetical protein
VKESRLNASGVSMVASARLSSCVNLSMATLSLFVALT